MGSRGARRASSSAAGARCGSSRRTGGAPRALTVLDAARHEVLHARPVVLPGERLVLFASQTTEPGAERIESVSIDGGPRSVVVERATTPVWSPTGHLLFSRDGAVLAVAFDARSGTPRGAAVPVLPSGAIEALASGQLALTLSSTGTLVFAPVGFKDTRVVSVSRDGAALALDLLPSNQYANPRISPDGRRLLVEIGGSVIEALDLARGTRARLTAATLSSVLFTTWNVDGTRVVFRRFGVPFWAAADGSGDSGPVPNATRERLSLLTRARSGLRHHPPPLSRDVGGCLPDVDERSL